MIVKEQNTISKSVYLHISLAKKYSVINLEKKKTLKANKSIKRIVWVFWIWVFFKIKYVFGDVLPHPVIVSPTQSRKTKKNFV